VRTIPILFVANYSSQ